MTEILKPFSGLENVPRETLMRAATRGSAVHALCSSIAAGDWMPEKLVPEELRGYVESFRKWSAQNVKKFLIIEKRFTATEAEPVDEGEDDEDREHTRLGYTGQPDFVVENTDGMKMVIDIKTTSQASRTHMLQVAAYSMLLRLHKKPVQAAGIVYLQKDGSDAKYLVFDNERSLGRRKQPSLKQLVGLFHSALALHKFFHPRRRKHGPQASKHIPKDPSDNGGLVICAERG